MAAINAQCDARFSLVTSTWPASNTSAIERGQPSAGAFGEDEGGVINLLRDERIHHVLIVASARPAATDSHAASG